MCYEPAILSEPGKSTRMSIKTILWGGISKDKSELKLPPAFHAAAKELMKNKKMVTQVQKEFHISDLRFEIDTFYFTTNEWWHKKIDVRYRTEEEWAAMRVA